MYVETLFIIRYARSTFDAHHVAKAEVHTIENGHVDILLYLNKNGNICNIQ